MDAIETISSNTVCQQISASHLCGCRHGIHFDSDQKSFILGQTCWSNLKISQESGFLCAVYILCVSVLDSMDVSAYSHLNVLCIWINLLYTYGHVDSKDFVTKFSIGVESAEVL